MRHWGVTVAGLTTHVNVEKNGSLMVTPEAMERKFNSIHSLHYTRDRVFPTPCSTPYEKAVIPNRERGSGIIPAYLATSVVATY